MLSKKNRVGKKGRSAKPLTGFEFRAEGGGLQALYKADFRDPASFYRERRGFKKAHVAVRDIRGK